MQVEKPQEHTYSKPKLGNATIIIDMKKIGWDELVKIIEYLQLNPSGHVVEVHIGEEIFDA